MLRQLSEIYSAVARRYPDGPSVAEVTAARSFLEFDNLVIAPRYGFRDARDYYRQASVGPRLSRRRVPSLLVAATEDPMVPAESLDKALEEPSENLQIVWSSRGGHLAFPRSPEILLGDGEPLESQVVKWLRQH